MKMMERHLFRILLALVFIPGAIAASGKTPPEDQARRDSLWRIIESREVVIGDKTGLLDVRVPAGEVPDLCFLPREHPAQDTVPAAIREAVAERTRLTGRDSLSSADLMWALRPYLRWLQRIDPHLRVQPQARLALKSRQAYRTAKNAPLPGFLLLNIRDTLLVERSVDPLFRPGDRLLAINGCPVGDYLVRCYDDRSIYSFTLMANHDFEMVRAQGYTVLFERSGERRTVHTAGRPWQEVYLGLLRQREFLTRIFPEAKAGYFAITEFYPNNGLLIKKLRRAILAAKEQGCTSFILDLRGNPGGNGSAFDDLLSIFINKPSIHYLKGQRVRVGPETLRDYDFLTDSMRWQLVDVPPEGRVAEVRLDRKKYIPGMKYYVLMNKDTGSVAASFCNILQFNDAAELVGEPLLENALRYGEVTQRWHGLTRLMLTVSTVEFDECTRAEDGVLRPDIPIPYVAADYLAGRDAMLVRLLDRIAQR